MFVQRRNLIAVIVAAVVLTVEIVVAAEWSGADRSIARVPNDAEVAGSPSTAVTPAPSPDLGNLNDDIGSVLVVSQTGADMSPTLRSLVVQGRVGGVLLFASNFKNEAGLRAWTANLRALASSACLDHPILVMLDEEGGQVNQVQASFAAPSELSAGAGGPDHVRGLERAVAAGLRGLGVGLDLAPVADVRTNPNDLVIGDRSFGSNPSTVAPLVAAAVKGLHDGGVGATLKHFPGLGGAAGDPHVAIPTDSESLAHWQRTQLPAFKAGIAAGADAVMTTAVYVPGLGAGTTPAMFSAPVVNRLRTQMGFSGVIMTDSVSMGGIGARYTLPQATVLALAAGNDMILLSNGDPTYERSAMAAVRAAVLSGRLDRTKLHESAMRVNRLRDEWGQPFTHCRPPTGG
jgi:beta-N-acetylhexosaminidase